MFDIFSHTEAWISLTMLTFMEVVLGIDNIIFISLIASRLQESERSKARSWGLGLALVFRIVLLFGISFVQSMNKPFISFEMFEINLGITGQSIILLIGGVFLLYKATNEIHEKLEGDPNAFGNDEQHVKVSGLTNGIIQIAILNLVFSFDSILTALGMTNGLPGSDEGKLIIMIISVVMSVGIMMLFAGPVGNFINDHPTIQMLGLSFLILISFLLIAEAMHQINHQLVGEIPKTYLYVVIIFSLSVEFLNIKLRKKHKSIQLRGISQEAKEDGLLD